MNDGFDRMIPHHPAQRLAVADVAGDEGNSMAGDRLEPVHDRGIAVRQIVETDDAVPGRHQRRRDMAADIAGAARQQNIHALPVSIVYRRSLRSEEHTSELQSLMRISYAV